MGPEAQNDLCEFWSVCVPSVLFPTGSRGREKGEFTNLQGVSAASSGRIVVADSNNQCIQVSSPLTANRGSQAIAYSETEYLWKER